MNSAAERKQALRRAIFLDRDGTVMIERDYVSDPDLVSLVPGAATAIKRFKEAGYAVVLVTNQSGIARGMYTEDDYRAVAARLDALLAAEDASPDATFYCPHHPDFTGPCTCRKPGTDMYRWAADRLGLSLADSVYVGDKISDVLPGVALGGRSILVLTGHGVSERGLLPAGVAVAEDLLGAAALILEEPGA